MNSLHEICTVPAFCEEYPDLMKVSQFRWAIYNRETNGLDESGAITKVGGRWYVHKPSLFRWLRGNRRDTDFPTLLQTLQITLDALKRKAERTERKELVTFVENARDAANELQVAFGGPVSPHAVFGARKRA